jgi:hypothetical protein
VCTAEHELLLKRKQRSMQGYSVCSISLKDRKLSVKTSVTIALSLAGLSIKVSRLLAAALSCGSASAALPLPVPQMSGRLEHSSGVAKRAPERPVAAYRLALCTLSSHATAS